MAAKLIFSFFLHFLPGSFYSINMDRCTEQEELVISILPLGEISDREIMMVRDSLRDFCNCEVRILDRIGNPKQFISIDNSINPFSKNMSVFLESFLTSNQERIIAITDISFMSKANDSSVQTIRGLTKGNIVIISTAQIFRDAAEHDMDYNHLLAKVAKHELGHAIGIINLSGTFGHYPDTLCIMTSSFHSSKNYFIRSEYFCDSCSSILKGSFSFNQ